MNQESVSIIVPALNEEGNIKPIVERINATMQSAGIVYEIIFIDDHSTDKTFQTIASLATQYPVFGYLKKGSKGKAQSILEGCEYANNPIVAFIDADLQYPPEVLPLMHNHIVKDGYDIVITRRKVKHSHAIRKLMSDSFRVIFSKWLHGLDFDVQSGLKMYRKEIMRAFELKPTPWSFDLEFLVKARDLGYTITSVDIHFADRTSGATKVGFIKSSYEVGMAAIKLKLSRIGLSFLSPRRLISIKKA